MVRSNIIPHLSWSGPSPMSEVDSYLLAMLLRVYYGGVDKAGKRGLSKAPSVLTTRNMGDIASLYAFYKEKMFETGANTCEGMLNLIKENADADLETWVIENQSKIVMAGRELIEYVETDRQKGFSSYG